MLIAVPPPVSAQILGSSPELSFLPDHGVPGALIVVTGTDWNAPSEGYCRILGDPVERYSCKVACQLGTCEPVGNFTVADMPAGRYLIKVEVDSPGYVPLHFGQWFTVDAQTTAMAVTPVLETTVSAVSLRTTYQSHSLAPTITTTVEHLAAPSAMELFGTQERGAFALVSLVVVAPLIYVFGKRSRRIPTIVKAEARFEAKPGLHLQYLAKLEALKAQGSVSDRVYRKLRIEYKEKMRSK